ncbi:MAG: phenylacetic acid degradation protein PaaD [Burkholderiales bacterium PBB5]|nr:MAG: phenylacetic acid degradation protein PaaD [Burkholderiales bacterium PBB5]
MAEPASPLTPQQTAEAVRDAMWVGDHATKMLGLRITAIAPGSATIEMTVRQDMLNGHAICHGGLITTLADSAFAFACNAYNELTVASGFTVDLVAPGRLDDVLTARCTEVSKAGRTGVYDVEVSNQRGERNAIFRGRSYTMRGKPVIPAA